jgi:hypothetical protein
MSNACGYLKIAKNIFASGIFPEVHRYCSMKHKLNSGVGEGESNCLDE